MPMSSAGSKDYVIDSDAECERLELQARLCGIEDHLVHLVVPKGARVLDVGCGSGSMARLIAKSYPEAEVIGVDVNARYLEDARSRAAREGLSNLAFEVGDACDLPFAEDTFDLVWSKYLLQWVNQPATAVREFVRVTRAGGRVVCCNFDGFGVEHYPAEENFLVDCRRFFSACVDPWIGRKVFSMLRSAGLRDVSMEIESDRLFTVAGAVDPERRRNWEIQLEAAFPKMVEVFGGEAGARAFLDRFFAVLDDPDTFSACALYTAIGTK
jgi:ubiquinone/menaquinone biosynthesis C-methylase UbiE